MSRLLLALSVWCVAWPSVAAPATPYLVVTVVDTAKLPIPAAHVQLKFGDAVIATADTNENGVAEFSEARAGDHVVVVTKDGFEPAETHTGLPQAIIVRTTVTLVPLSRTERVEVKGTAAPVEEAAPTGTTLAAKTAKELPGRPATVEDALPLIPGVVRRPDGGLQISASGEHRSAMIVNSADVTDPATGQFGLTVPIDVVDTMNVHQPPFKAEYGKFTAGLVAVETRRGTDKWNWELNDPFPEFYIRSWQLRGLRDATPRINAEGPIVKGKLYFSEGLEYEVRKVEVYTLPFPYNRRKKEGVNSFAQFDWIASSKNLMTATFHVAPQRLEFVNLDYFNPPSTTPDSATHNYTGTISDRLSIWHGLLENTVSVTQFGARVWGKGDADFILTPMGRAGNYFADQSRTANRFSYAPSFTLLELHGAGNHTVKIGAYLAESTVHGRVTDHPISILDEQFRLTEQITFSPGRSYGLRDEEYDTYAQDHWSISSRLSADVGVRVESQEVSQSFRVAPRAALAWNPFEKAGTVIRAGFGFFYDHVPLNIYAFNLYPKEFVTYYGPDGAITGGPFFYGNALSEVNVRRPFVFRNQGPGNFSPQSATGSIQIEQPVGHNVKLRAAYMHNQSAGLVIMEPTFDPVSNIGANQLSGSGDAHYHQFEVTTRVHLGDSRELFFSYVNSRGRGDLNDFNNYLGSFPMAVIRPNLFGNLPGDLPHRFLSWGTVPLSHGFRIAPMLEYRNGFPYFMVDAAQNYAGVPNEKRYPNFFSVDSRVSKDIKVNPKYSVRLAVTGYNLTNHFNPEAFHNNIADPAQGVFFGARHRRFTLDFDVLF